MTRVVFDNVWKAYGARVLAVVSSEAKGELLTVSTDLFVAQVSTQGGDIVGLEFNDYKSTVDK